MSKIIKHTFEIPNLYVENGELVEGKPTEKTYTFTLLFKGTGLYEEITGKTLFSDLMSKSQSGTKEELAANILDRDFIQTLASVSYVKIDGNKFHNNHVTIEEFKKSPAYSLVGQDLDFITKLMQMAIDCINADDGKRKTKEVSSPKK